MKKSLIILFLICFTVCPAFSAVDRYSKEYLQSGKHFSIMNPIVEKIVEKGIKSALKKETGAKFDVSFTGYTTSSMKKGIFKFIEIFGRDLTVNNIPIQYAHLKSLSDYNYIDYTKNPIEFKSDMEFMYNMEITDESINAALNNKKYQNILKNVNNIAYPLFVAKGVKTKIVKDKMYIVLEYNFPIVKASKDKTFVISSDFQVVDGKVKAKNVHLDSAYGNIPLDKVANLINLLNPLEFTLELLETKHCHGIIENVNIFDNKVKVNGKIFVKGD